LDAALPGIVQSIKNLPIEYKLSQLQANNLLEAFEDLRMNRLRTHTYQLFMECIPHFKMLAKCYDAFFACFLEEALMEKNVEFENFCLSNIPGTFAATYGMSFAFMLFIRAYLNNNEKEMEYYLKETLKLFMGRYRYNYLAKKLPIDIEKITEMINKVRPIVLKEQLLLALKKEKYNGAFDIIKEAEFYWDIPNIEADYNHYATHPSTLELKVPQEKLKNISDEIKTQIKDVLDIVNPCRDDLTEEYIYIEKVEYKIKLSRGKYE
jgi:hypothetical protein